MEKVEVEKCCPWCDYVAKEELTKRRLEAKAMEKLIRHMNKDHPEEVRDLIESALKGDKV